MAEVLGLIAGVITVAQSVIKGVKYIKSVYHAREEFEMLQGQLEDFTDLIEEIRKQHAFSVSAAISTSLHRSKLAITSSIDSFGRNYSRVPTEPH